MLVTIEGVNRKTFSEYPIATWEFDGTEQEFSKYEAANLCISTDLTLESDVRDDLVIRCGDKEFRFGGLWLNENRR